MTEDLANIDDIKIKDIPVEDLTKFLNFIKTMKREAINNLIIRLGKTNTINPNKNEFYTCTQKNIEKHQKKLI